jgi:hypothetical protein
LLHRWNRFLRFEIRLGKPLRGVMVDTSDRRQRVGIREQALQLLKRWRSCQQAWTPRTRWFSIAQGSVSSSA